MLEGDRQPVISLRSFGFTYAGAEAPALEAVDLEVGNGEMVLLAGPSASGKSTLMRTVCGLVPHFHGGEVSGHASTAGLDVLSTGPGELAAVVGYLAQEPETQIVSSTVAAEIGLGLVLRGVPEAARARAVEEVALALAIPDILERTVEELSGGELQRLALAAALVTRPGVILLDEPTSQLDPVAGDELIWLLRRLNSEWGVTVVISEHRLERCLSAADRVVAMDSGRIAFDGAPERFLTWAERATPSLTTPSARMFSLAGIESRPTGVRAARRTLTTLGLGQGREDRFEARAEADPGRTDDRDHRGPRDRSRRSSSGRPVLRSREVWIEVEGDPDPVEVIRGIDLEIGAGEKVALMGRNGAGKSTFLRAAAGLFDPVRGRVDADDGIALLTQSPGDFLIRERVTDELPSQEGSDLLNQLGLAGLEDRDPRDLSGGQRQRLALAIVLAGRLDRDGVPGLIALDEPTRGLDRALKQGLVELSAELADRGSAVLIATHDVEFAAAFADRVILLGKGVVIADGPAREVLSGGWYFATEVSRILELPGLVTPEQGAAWLHERRGSAIEV